MLLGRSSVVALLVTAVAVHTPALVSAADFYVPAGGDLQAAINSARGGDTILLEPGATFVGNFRLPVHAGSQDVTIRSAASDTQLPPSGTRITPAHAPLLPKLRSSNSQPVLATLPGASNWRLLALEFQSNYRGYYDILTLGDGTDAQQSLAQVPSNLTLERIYMHADPLFGQKRAIALNSGRTTIRDSHIEGMRATGQDSQAISGWNGPGPYTIENNYLEGAGEVVIFGGADPAIPNLVPTNIVVRGNTLTRPLEWRNPIVPTPRNVVPTLASSGFVASGAYVYKVVASRAVTDDIVFSAAAEVSVSLPFRGSVALRWDPVPNAAQYRIYRRSGNTEQYWTTTALSFTDSGLVAGTAGSPPTPARWEVKNLFELKNARQVRLEDNVLENNWAHAQAGVAVVLTPRNQDGRCPWCTVEDVSVERNVIRRTGAGFVLLGYDDNNPSQQLNRIVIRNNVVSDMGWKWEGSGYFVTIINGPRDVVVDHNTIISEDGVGIVAIDGAPVPGFIFTNNVARHNLYGIIGRDRGPGLQTIEYFFPGSVITRNVFAGMPDDPNAYPAGNEYPSIPAFEAHFTDYAGGDYSLRPDTDWANAGTDGKDLGANQSAPRIRAPANPRLTR
jgi:hypothetical protein